MRLGVFGGTFDPVHFGHLTTVEAAASKFGLRRVIYVPARVSPLKTLPATDTRHRVAMLALGLAGRPDWPIWLGELDREPPSYTVDTLRALSRENPGDELWLLLGTDALAGFDRWREPEEIVRLARVAAFLREPFAGPGLKVPPVPGLANRLEVFDAGSVKISATELRRDLERGVGVAGRVPGPVAEYITKQGLYGSGVTRR
ncbi:MAG TPA: nicotinate (nicotinamide) nucleotide adenylyltransferase [Thermoanaerobaculia bacterium]|nr:nicotinate (nicotinamide) nucleotide adenylyltransferase [Thermoanaerobaculia bacterium]